MNIYGQVGWRAAASVNPVGGCGYADTDVCNFITAASITDTTQKNAINTLVTDLKAANIWTKMKAIYPFVGGTAAQHRFNLKDPRAVDAAFYLTFFGGGTHSATGYLPNGNSYADTKFNPLTLSSLTSLSLTYYSLTPNTTGTSRCYIGCADGIQSYNNFTALGFFSGGTLETSTIGGERTGASYTPPSSNSAFAGLHMASVNGSRVNTYYKNGVKNTNTVTQVGALPNVNMYIGANNALGTAELFQNVGCAFSSIGDGLSDTNATALYTAVQAFNTTLGRNV